MSISGLFLSEYIYCPGADPGFQVRGGALKFFFGGISCKKSRFYAKKSYFFPILGGIRPCVNYYEENKYCDPFFSTVLSVEFHIKQIYDLI